MKMIAKPKLQSLRQDAPDRPVLPLPPPIPNRPVLMVSTVGSPAAAFEYRFAAIQLSASCIFRMNASTPSATRRDYLPAFCQPFVTPFELHAKFRHVCSSGHTIQPFSCLPE